MKTIAKRTGAYCAVQRASMAAIWTAVNITLAHQAKASTYTVTNNNALGSGSLSFAMSQAQSDSNAVIDINSAVGTITLTGALPMIENNLVINGGGIIVSGANANRIFFVNAAGDNVQISGLTLTAGFAQGGVGGQGNGGGGGGAGLGGAIYLNAGNLTVSGITFSTNSAQGGAGGYGGGNSGAGGGGGGGGGMGFSGGDAAAGTQNNETYQGPGGGGGALTSAGATASLNSSTAAMGGGVNGGAGGNLVLTGSAGSGASPTLPDGGGGGGGLSLDIGAGQGGNGGNGSDFSGGGGAGSSYGGNSGVGGNGGFGGGGGGGAAAGFNGGNGGIGGFGGGGGAGGITNSTGFGSVNGHGAAGGFGGGTGATPGSPSIGGGGLGAGGAIFARAGSTLLIQDSSFTGDSVSGGSGAVSGSAIGQALFLGANVNYSVSTGTTTVSDSIGGGNDANAQGSFTKSGAGTLALSGTESYVGSTTVSAGTLEVINNAIPSASTIIDSDATLDYNYSSRIFQTPTTYTGDGTLRETGIGNLVFGGLGIVNVDLSAGAVIDIETGLLTGSSSYQGIWTSNMASLNIAGGAVFDALEAGPTATMQIDALTGAGRFQGGYFTNNNGGLSTVTVGVAGGSGIFSGVLQDDPSSHLAVVKTGTGTEAFSGANSYTGGTSVTGGTLLINSTASLPDAALNVSSTGELQLAPSIGGVSVQSLSITGSGKLDLSNNHMFIPYAPGTQMAADAAIRADLVSGYAGGTWTGSGIDSSVAALPANNSHYAIGYADGADGVVAGLSTGQIEVKYTLYGDANLDGVVNGVDFTILVGNLGKSLGAWDKGDFNYDGVVSGVDFTELVGNLGRAANGASVTLPSADLAAIDAFAAANGLMADVPEPTSVGLFAIAAIGVLSRRRRSVEP